MQSTNVKLCLLLLVMFSCVDVITSDIPVLGPVIRGLIKVLTDICCGFKQTTQTNDNNDTLQQIKQKPTLEEYTKTGEVPKQEIDKQLNISRSRGFYENFICFSSNSYKAVASFTQFLLKLPYKLIAGEIIPLPTGDLIVDIHRIMALNHFLTRKYEEFQDFVSERFKDSILDQTVIRSYIEDKPFLKYLVSKNCFDKIGCFYTENSVDFLNRWIAFIPYSPKVINMSLTVFNTTNTTIREVFSFDIDSERDRQRIIDVFNCSGTFVIFITHGYQDLFNEENWNSQLKNQLIKNNIVRTVIVVDWSGGSVVPFYGQAVANTKVVGTMLAYFIKKLQQYVSIDSDDIHLVGHSLGAQISGLAAKYFKNPKIGRITALDPAGPQFYRVSNVTRLSRFDAKVVRAIHTDAGYSLLEGFGIEDPLGDYDFYPNGGTHQYGCFTGAVSTRVLSALQTVSCGHHRAVDLAIDRNYRNGECFAIGYECTDFSTFLEARCATCEREHNCREMNIQFGRPTDDYKRDINRKYFIITDRREPYYVYHYQLALRTSSRLDLFVISGRINITIITNETIPINVIVDLNLFKFEGKQIYTFLLLTRHFLVKPKLIRVFINADRIADTERFVQFVPFVKRIGTIDDFSIGIDHIELNYMSHLDRGYRLNNSEIFCPQDDGVVRQRKPQFYISCPNQDIIVDRAFKLRFDKLQPLDPKIKNIEYSTFNRGKFLINNNTRIIQNNTRF